MAIKFPIIDIREAEDALHNPEVDGETGPGCQRIATIFSWVTFLTGLFMVFVVSPALMYGDYGSFEDGHGKDGPLGEEPLSGSDHPLLRNVRSTLIDPDTPTSALMRNSVLGKGNLKLVFSDEFNKDGRTFYEGDDPFWQALDLYYAATHDLAWYDPDTVTTKNGTLQIRLDPFENHGLNYRSGMVQSWNKLCFKGGVLEVSTSLPGPPGVSGLWPGVWTLGNIARPGYKATTEGVWPYSYNTCDVGITPNQSSPNGMSLLPGQKLASCVCEGQDHPNYGTGRGAPEIDVLEATADRELSVGVVTQTLQVAPFDIQYKPNYDYLVVNSTNVTEINAWSGGPLQESISGITKLKNEWYDNNQYQKYSFEYIPGDKDGAIAWFMGDQETFRMLGPAVGPNGNIGPREVSREPMSVVMNLAFSEAWGWIDWANLKPKLDEGMTMYIDYIRIYQEEGKESITCDPPGYPTTDYIEKHAKAYTNPNFTAWEDTGYSWPKNKLMHGC
ncbi:beta-glucan synthesis-associated [Tuber borchii]|uniref:Beta-glucan synthesis-associated n=1 Tax=Tuber borchii TaxID=42251 RepID=A0A2T6ZX79_TUBBO|nr:beta-glucan synthesis-associated [Tuber borchii]